MYIDTRTRLTLKTTTTTEAEIELGIIYIYMYECVYTDALTRVTLIRSMREKKGGKRKNKGVARIV